MLHNDRPEDAAKKTGHHRSRFRFAPDVNSPPQVCRRVLLCHCPVPPAISIYLSTQCDLSTGNITVLNGLSRSRGRDLGVRVRLALLSPSMIGREEVRAPAENRDDALEEQSGIKSTPREMLAREARPRPHSEKRLSRYGPVFLWALAIFVFSSGLFSGSNTSTFVRPLFQWVFPSISDAALGLVHGLIRKAGHFVEYAIFALLLARAFRTSARDFLTNHWFAVSLSFVALYALSDEFHQSFVSSRTASIYDCLIDTAGGLAALMLTHVRSRREKAA